MQTSQICECVRFVSFIIPLERGKNADFKLWIQIHQADLTDWMSSYRLNSWRKQALIQKPPPQIPKAFNPPGIAEKTKKYLGINALI